MRVIIASPYPEGSINSIARSLHCNELQRLYVTLHGRRYTRVLDRLWGNPVWLSYQLNRRWGEFPVQTVEQVATAPEIARALLEHSPKKSWAAKVMYQGKRMFDERVSQRIEAEEYDVVVGMQGSCSRTLSRAKDMGRLTVLNHVNSHAETHNRMLQQLGGAPPGHHELIPDATVADETNELVAADVILVPSGYVARQLLVAGVAPQKIHVQPYGVDSTRFTPELSSRSGRERVRCLFVGGVSLRKGTGALLEAARQLVSRPVEFDLIGPLSRRGALDGAPGNVTYHGILSSSEVARAMQAADIFVFPTLDDACPLAVFEAMASGLPVIVTEHAGNSELISDGIDGILISPGDPGAISQAIDRLAGDPGLREMMGRAARSKVQATWTWRRHGAAVRRTIERLATSPTAIEGR